MEFAWPGFRMAQGIGTSVNGFAFFDFLGANFVAGDLIANMGGGNDRVDVEVNVSDTVTLNMGSGIDAVEVTSLIGGKLVVKMGGSVGSISEGIRILNTNVSGKTKVTGSTGNDDVFVAVSNFLSTAKFKLGGGNDVFDFEGSNSGVKLRANGGGGLDSLFTPFPQFPPMFKKFDFFGP